MEDNIRYRADFISDRLKTFYQNMNIEQSISSSYNHQKDDQAEAWVQICKENHGQGYKKIMKT